MVDVAPAIAAHLSPRRASQEHFVGRNPLDPLFGEERYQRLADRALTGPHALWSFTEAADMAFDGSANVRLRVFRMTAAMGGQGDFRHGLASQRLVDQQGQNWVIVGGRRELDLTTRGQLAMKRDHPRHQLTLFVQEPLLVFLGVMAALVSEFSQLEVFLEEQGVDPRQV